MQDDLVALQREILSKVKMYVKPGGTLIYSTCTIHVGENMNNVEWFLKEHPAFDLVSMEQMFPGETYHDGFFVAKLRKLK